MLNVINYTNGFEKLRLGPNHVTAPLTLQTRESHGRVEYLFFSLDSLKFHHTDVTADDVLIITNPFKAMTSPSTSH